MENVCAAKIAPKQVVVNVIQVVNAINLVSFSLLQLILIVYSFVEKRCGNEKCKCENCKCATGTCKCDL
jgi:hypothetical protein